MSKIHAKARRVEAAKQPQGAIPVTTEEQVNTGIQEEVQSNEAAVNEESHGATETGGEQESTEINSNTGSDQEDSEQEEVKAVEESQPEVQEASQEEASSDQQEEAKQEESQEQPKPEEEPAVVEPPAAKAEPAVVVKAAKKAQAAEAPRDNDNVKYLDGVREQGTELQKRALAAIENFVQGMRPRQPLDEAKAITVQRDFLSHLLSILKKDYADFKPAWTTLLVYFAEHHGQRPTAKDYTALSEYSTDRYTFAWKDQDKMAAYTGLVTLLRATRNTATRKQDAKTVRIDLISPSVLDQKMISNLQQFYGL